MKSKNKLTKLSTRDKKRKERKKIKDKKYENKSHEEVFFSNQETIEK